MGSSAASATCLRAILRLPGLQVVGVVTQPDRPAGRGRDLTPCPCRRYAAERGITECITPENVNAPEAVEWIRAKKPDVIVVVAFGQFLNTAVIYIAAAVKYTLFDAFVLSALCEYLAHLVSCGFVSAVFREILLNSRSADKCYACLVIY